MPIDTTHLHLSALVLEELRDFDTYAFCLGSIAPDCVDLADGRAFNITHNVDSAGRFDYIGFYGENLSSNVEEDLVTRSYLLGYYCHLWLDEFTKKASKQILIKPIGKQQAGKQATCPL